MSGWRWKPKVAAVSFAVYLLIQLALPVARMFNGSEGMQRFGWQMFSRASVAIEFTVTTASGQVTVTPSEVLARARGEFAQVALIPPFLCETTEGAIRVTWDGGEHPC